MTDDTLTARRGLLAVLISRVERDVILPAERALLWPLVQAEMATLDQLDAAGPLADGAERAAHEEHRRSLAALLDLPGAADWLTITRRLTQTVAGRETWRTKALEMEEDRDRLGLQYSETMNGAAHLSRKLDAVREAMADTIAYGADALRAVPVDRLRAALATPPPTGVAEGADAPAVPADWKPSDDLTGGNWGGTPTPVGEDDDAPSATCRRVPTCTCPPSYNGPCGDRPCARFESDDPTPWTADAGPTTPRLDALRAGQPLQFCSPLVNADCPGHTGPPYCDRAGSNPAITEQEVTDWTDDIGERCPAWYTGDPGLPAGAAPPPVWAPVDYRCGRRGHGLGSDHAARLDGAGVFRWPDSIAVYETPDAPSVQQ